MAKVTIAPGLLAILCCPDTKQEVALAPDAVIEKMNAAIARGELLNRAKQPVTERLDGGLLRADREVLYPVRDDIPVMLIEKAIPAAGYL